MFLWGSVWCIVWFARWLDQGLWYYNLPYQKPPAFSYYTSCIFFMIAPYFLPTEQEVHLKTSFLVASNNQATAVERASAGLSALSRYSKSTYLTVCRRNASARSTNVAHNFSLSKQTTAMTTSSLNFKWFLGKSVYKHLDAMFRQFFDLHTQYHFHER